MKIKLIDVESNENGLGGIFIQGAGDVHLERVKANKNMGQGIEVLSAAEALFKDWGLPLDSDPAEVAEVLQEIIALPADSRAEVLARTGLIDKCRAAMLDVTTIVANLVSVSNDPRVQHWIALLFSVFNR